MYKNTSGILLYYLFLYHNKVINIMKISVLILFIGIFSISAKSYSQEAKISLEVENATVNEVFEMIRAQTSYSFWFDLNNVDISRKVSVKAEKQTVKNILSTVLKGQDLDIRINGDHIVIVPKGTFPGITSMQEKRKITGVVIDERGDPVIGANIIEEGTSNGVVTDIDGQFSITLSGNVTLKVTYIGYAEQQIVVGNKTHLDITLKEDLKSLDEVVVVGYGTKKRVNLTGAIETVDSKTFDSRATANVETALQGAIPGLMIQRSGGAVGGDNITMNIRGLSSLNGGNPLVLVDGIEGELSNLNPADIESISVLKDASASIYGARASNGVLLVTTKSGNSGALKVSVNSYYAIKKATNLKKMASLLHYAEMDRLACADGSRNPEYTEEEIEMIRNNDPTVIPNGIWGAYPKMFRGHDWQKSVIGSGHLTNVNLNISGGKEAHTYMISGNFQDEKGLMKFGKDRYTKYNIRVKNDIEITKWFDLQTNLSFDMQDLCRATALDGEMFERLIKSRSWSPMYNPEGNFNTFQDYVNPAQLLEEGGDWTQKYKSMNANVKAEFDVFKDLKIIAQGAVKLNDTDWRKVKQTFQQYNWENKPYQQRHSPNSANSGYQSDIYGIANLYADYKIKIADHEITAMAGFSHEQNNRRYIETMGQNIENNELFTQNFFDKTLLDATEQIRKWTVRSLFGRVGYTFADKYMLEANLRYDGSSRFRSGHQWGLFSGVSAGWRISEEKFLKELNLFDQLKLRLSYGEMGNQDGIGLYDHVQMIKIENEYPFGDDGRQQSARLDGMVSQNRTWERVSIANIGLDVTTLNGRLDFSGDIYRRENNDMLVSVKYPTVLGSTAPTTNNGELETKGWEVSVGWNDKIGDFRYSVRATLSDAKSIVTKLEGGDQYTEGWNELRQGYPVNSIFGYKFDGIIQTEEELAEYKKMPGVVQNITVGYAKYRDVDGNGEFNPYGDKTKGETGDLVYLGNESPRYLYSFNGSLGWKMFDFSFMLQGVGQRTVFQNGDLNMPFNYWWHEPLEYFYGKTWTPENRNAKYPMLTSSSQRSWNFKCSDNNITNAAYLRVKNIQLGYTLPKELAHRAGLEKLRIYVSGDDILTFHKVPGGYDPEEGRGYQAYPFTSFWSVGFNLVF